VWFIAAKYQDFLLLQRYSYAGYVGRRMEPVGFKHLGCTKPFDTICNRFKKIYLGNRQIVSKKTKTMVEYI